MSRLSAIGLYCVHSDSYSDDVWLKLPDGSICTIQVKTATYDNRRYSRGFHTSGSDADLYAFVDLKLERIIYRLGRSVAQKYCRIKQDQFTPEEELSSLLHCLDKAFNITPPDANI